MEIELEIIEKKLIDLGWRPRKRNCHGEEIDRLKKRRIYLMERINLKKKDRKETIEKKRQWKEKNRDKVLKHDITYKNKKRFFKEGVNCAFCNDLAITNTKIDPYKEYAPDNVLPCCFICEKMKGSHSSEYFLAYCASVYEYGIYKTPSRICYEPRLDPRDLAKKQGVTYEISDIKAANIMNGPCLFCGLKPCCGLDRISKSEGYIIGNVQPSCKFCIYSRGKLSNEEFLSQIEKIVLFRKPTSRFKGRTKIRALNYCF